MTNNNDLFKTKTGKQKSKLVKSVNFYPYEAELAQWCHKHQHGDFSNFTKRALQEKKEAEEGKATNIPTLAEIRNIITHIIRTEVRIIIQEELSTIALASPPLTTPTPQAEAMVDPAFIDTLNSLF